MFIIRIFPLKEMAKLVINLIFRINKIAYHLISQFVIVLLRVMTNAITIKGIKDLSAISEM